MPRGIFRVSGSIATRWGGQGAVALYLGLLLLLAAGPARAQTSINVANASQLVTALGTVDSNPGTSYVINLTGNITLTAGTTLPAINSTSTVTINGGNFTLNGSGVQRGLFVYKGTVAVNNLTIQNTVARGAAAAAASPGAAVPGSAGRCSWRPAPTCR
jgi:hypothetical protein